MRKEPGTQRKSDAWEGHASQLLLFPSLPTVIPPFRPFAHPCYSPLSFTVTPEMSHLAWLLVSAFLLPPDLESFDPHM